jgi:formylglycine-generating enzyme required for sulfatase activity
LNSLGVEMLRVDPSRHPRPGEPRISYYLSATEITNQQLERFRTQHRAERPAVTPGDEHPATRVTYDEADRFVSRLARLEGRLYALPTEAEWQWAAGGGERRLRYATADGSVSHDLANYAGTGGRDRFTGAAPVASFPPNPLGFHDMSGNVWEWCRDWYEPERRAHRVWIRSRFLPPLPAAWYGTLHKWRVLRGGSFLHDEPLLKVTVRNAYRPDRDSPTWGFRLALPAAGYRP